MFEGNVIKTFAQLQDKYNLPSSDLYRYLQLRSYIKKHQDWELLRKESSNIEKHFTSLVQKKGHYEKTNFNIVPKTADGHV